MRCDSIQCSNAFFGHWRNSATKKVSTRQAHSTREESDVGGHVSGRSVATNVQTDQTYGDAWPGKFHVTSSCLGIVATVLGCGEHFSCSARDEERQSLRGSGEGMEGANRRESQAVNSSCR